jgi:hypothetical protein
MPDVSTQVTPLPCRGIAHVAGGTPTGAAHRHQAKELTVAQVLPLLDHCHCRNALLLPRRGIPQLAGGCSASELPPVTARTRRCPPERGGGRGVVVLVALQCNAASGTPSGRCRSVASVPGAAHLMSSALRGRRKPRGTADACGSGAPSGHWDSELARFSGGCPACSRLPPAM